MSRRRGSISFDLPPFAPYNSGVRDWNLSVSDPLSLRIAADARLTTPNYLDDHIWELRLAGGEPEALALETSYGLRARSMRIFPGFRLGDDTLLAPAHYHQPPRLHTVLPNYLRLSCAPFAGVGLTAEYWAPESNLIGGRFTLHNRSSERLQLSLLLHAVLRPGEGGQSMSSLTQQGAMVLQGATGDLVPLIFLAGGAQTAVAPYPALLVRPVLEADAVEQFVWAQAAAGELGGSFQLARELAARNWDAELARVEQLNAGWVDLETGNLDWDAALAMGQKVSLGAYLGPTNDLAHPAPVLARGPDTGHSARGDGRDHGPGWEGISAGEAYVHIGHVLPSAPELAQGLLLNFLATQSPDGSIDARPGLGGQRSGWLGPPLLSTLALRIYRHTQDRTFLDRAYGRLIEFVEAWFQSGHDRDQDGHPEWDHTLQSGFDDWPAFDLWSSWGQGLDLSCAETVDLACYLLRELGSLHEIGRLLGDEADRPELRQRARRLRAAVDRAWSDKHSCYLSVDRDLHVSLPGSRLGSGKGEFTLELDRQFDPPVRVLARARAPQEIKAKLHLFIHGRGRTNRKRVERLTQRKFHWFSGTGSLTTERPYSRIDRIEVRGLDDSVRLQLRTPDFQRRDQTGFLPLWAGAAEEKRAAQLVDRTLLEPAGFWRKHGVPCCPADDPAYASDRVATVWMQWNVMLGEGLVDYGYLQQAAELVERLMQACISTLKQDGCFRQAYYADGAGGIGERDHLAGVAPLGLLLYVLGVRLISADKLALRGANPFPWPIRLGWRGLRIEWEVDSAWVSFPSGERVEVVGPEVQVVERLAEAPML